MKKIVLSFVIAISLCVSGAWAVLADGMEESTSSSSTSAVTPEGADAGNALTPGAEGVTGTSTDHSGTSEGSQDPTQNTGADSSSSSSTGTSEGTDPQGGSDASSSSEDIPQDIVPEEDPTSDSTEPVDISIVEEPENPDDGMKLPPSEITITEEETAPVEAPQIVAFVEDGYHETAYGTTLEELMAKFPTEITAYLANGQSVRLPVNWYCEGSYDGNVDGYYTFDSYLSPLYYASDAIPAYSFAPDLRMPRIVVRVLQSEEAASQVMDDVTAAYIGPVAGEKEIFEYLIKDMKLNYAAACGVLANIYFESNFNPHAIGDGGTSYGLCQWHLGRYTSLVNFCKEENLAYGSIKGQLRYMEHELETGYSSVLEYLRSVPNTEAGAFQAAYYWCFHFERPAHIYDQSNLRGNAAKNSYWPRYKEYKIKVRKNKKGAWNEIECMEQ